MEHEEGSAPPAHTVEYLFKSRSPQLQLRERECTRSSDLGTWQNNVFFHPYHLSDDDLE